ncbi:MAG: hypothetical protein JNL70_15355 [Saprospiraceae bacterium]|nr:hypothetical protein [Saprospiraceae bacterium]
MTRQLSSSWTLALRIFLPTFWIAFFGTFFMATLFTDKNQIGQMSMNGLRWGLLVFITIFVIIFWKTVLRLKRIDADKDYVIVTNYFKTVRYPHIDVEKIELSKGFIFTYGTLVLKGKGRFGDRILFLASRKRVEIFIAENPQIKDWLQEA